MVIFIVNYFHIIFFIEDIKLGNEEGEEDMSSSGEESDEDNCHRGKMRKLNPPKGEKKKKN